jgi:broad specificity phosphatase PhoE
MSAPELLLIKHATPAIRPNVPANQWHLSAAGREGAAKLAGVLKAHAPQALAASLEPKAAETAAIIGEFLGLPVELVPGLHEHERSRAPFGSPAEFEANVKACLARPAELVFGDETADQAHARFAAALEGLLARYPAQTLAVVAHGTVISLFVARRCGLEPFGLWRKLGLPALIVLSRPGLELRTVVGNIE